MAHLPPAHEVLGAMITPALLISASGTLILSTTNRLSRVVDRVRTLGKDAEGLPDGKATTPEDAGKRELIGDQLQKLSGRIRLLQSALTALYLAVGSLVACSLSVGLITTLGRQYDWVPVGLALGGAAAMFWASLMLVREARVAVKATLHEMTYVGQLVARKTGRGGW